MRHILLAALAAALLCTVPLSATVIGNLTTNACVGDGVTVTATMIDWLPAGGGSGCITTGVPTNVTYAGGSLGVGATGSILDLTFGNTNVDGFMTFSSAPGLFFDLRTIGNGVANNTCVNVFDPNAPSCAAQPGSPITLVPGLTGTTAILTAFGLARDGTSPDSSWLGTFSVSFAGETPAQLQARFQRDGFVTSGHTGSFVVQPLPSVPEPLTLSLVGAGLLALSFVRKRSVQRP